MERNETNEEIHSLSETLRQRIQFDEFFKMLASVEMSRTDLIDAEELEAILERGADECWKASYAHICNKYSKEDIETYLSLGEDILSIVTATMVSSVEDAKDVEAKMEA